MHAHFTSGNTTYQVNGGRAGLLYLVLIAGSFLYDCLLQGATGWTVGKLATGVRVVNGRGQVAGVGPCTVR